MKRVECQMDLDDGGIFKDIFWVNFQSNGTVAEEKFMMDWWAL